MEKIKEVSNKYGTYKVGEMVGVHALAGMYWRNSIGVLSEVWCDNATISGGALYVHISCLRPLDKDSHVVLS
ncbi:hypothetical protein [Prevotella disiens]|uniref:hypothetical protein n=1 Tax=Prevotella disiens TaxID=28130 RepID=UPI00242FB605|nr:hypothetical protein [Prevotella disiens]